MKKFVVAAVLFLSSIAFADSLPKELSDLVPASGEVSYHGQTPDGGSCDVSFKIEYGVFEAEMNVDGAFLADFQLGFGYNLESLNNDNQALQVVTIHKAEEQYESDARSTMTVTKDGEQIRSVYVLQERKGLFGYKTEAQGTCNF